MQPICKRSAPIEAGFSLIELILVCVVLFIVAGIAVLSSSSGPRKLLTRPG
jgi:type II secretory pathway pseudopilin PulG